jgi:hypothetical protein
VQIPATPDDVRNLGWAQLQILAAQLVADIATVDTSNVTTKEIAPGVIAAPAIPSEQATPS